MKISLAPWLTPIAAVLLIAATSPARAQQPAQPATESAALDLYREWKAEPDPTRKAALGQRIVAEHFGTKAAEAVGYAGMFPQPDNPASKLEMSRTYYDASLASGETGAYVEYALGILATLEQDPRKALEYARAFAQKFPSGKLIEYVRKAAVAARYKLFDAAMSAKNYTEAATIANEAFAAKENEFLYAYLLSSAGLADLTAVGGKSQFVTKVGPWADRAAKYVESGQIPDGTDKAKWEAEKPKTLAMLYKAQAADRFLQLAASRPADPAAFQPIVELAERAAALDPNDPVVVYYLAQALNAQYAIYAQRYDDLSEADKMGEPGKRLLEQINDLADRVKAVHEKIRPGSVPSYVVPPRRVDPNRPEG